MANITPSLKNVRGPELVLSLSMATLSLPCYQAARDQRNLADDIQREYPSQSEYIRTNAELPQGLGNTLAGTAALIFPFCFRRGKEGEDGRS